MGADGTETVREVAVEAPEAATAVEWPAECTAPAGIVVQLACAGGGRALVDGFVADAPELPGCEFLPGLGERMPGPSFGSDAGFAIALDTAFEALLRTAGDMYPNGKTDDAQVRFGEYSNAAGGSYMLIRSSPNLHYNAMNGLAMLDTSRSYSADADARRKRDFQDLQMSAEDSDRAFASSIGSSLGDVAIGMKNSQYGASRAAQTLCGGR